MFYIYYNSEEQKNVVTYYYMSVIEQAIARIGCEVKELFHCPQKVDSNDTIVTLDVYSFWKSYRKHPKHTILWIQGIMPEETKMKNMNFFMKYLLIILYTFCEKFAFKHCDLILFVSEGMLNHYRRKYGYKGNNYIIMPCSNEKELYQNAFYDDKYSKPVFMYSGDINEWQCFDEMLILYKKIKEVIPASELRVYTWKQDLAKKKFEQYGVDATVECKKQEELNDAIKSAKYGFLIRKDVAVNNVASPTKMSTYISNGIIPLFSSCIGDYAKHIGALHYSVPLGNNSEGIEKVFELEKGVIHSKDVKSEYEKVFEGYYNSHLYVSKIAEKMQSLGIS